MLELISDFGSWENVRKPPLYGRFKTRLKEGFFYSFFLFVLLDQQKASMFKVDSHIAIFLHLKNRLWIKFGLKIRRRFSSIAQTIEYKPSTPCHSSFIPQFETIDNNLNIWTTKIWIFPTCKLPHGLSVSSGGHIHSMSLSGWNVQAGFECI